jgi:hypothetical protein
MPKVPQGLPICSRLFADDEIARQLELASEWARMADSVATALTPADALDRDELRQWRDEAARHREFRRAVIPGDRVWFTAGPPSHPEAEYGVPYLVVVRGADVITMYRPGDSDGAGWDMTILAPTKRLTREEVIVLASDWVRARYPTVPAVARVLEFSDQVLDQLERATGKNYSPSERRQFTSRWWVVFAPGDGDQSGLPTSLRVNVDDVTGEADLAR